jgi:TldD protein
MSAAEVMETLKQAAASAGGFVELRYHAKTSRGVVVEKGKVESSSSRSVAGLGVRVLENGAWGFASTGSSEPADVKRAIESARAAARSGASLRSEAVADLPEVKLATGDFSQPGVDEIEQRSLEEKVGMARKLEETVRSSSSSISSATCGYSEIFEEKAIVTTDGAAASFRLVRPELRLQAVAERNGEMSTGFEAMGTTGGWECLFRHGDGEYFAGKAARTAVDLLSAGHPQGGRVSVILAPSIVGLLVHEAIGHTVEADFVQAGSVAAGKLGQRVASDLVTLCDSGASELEDGAGGTIPVDDEGVLAGRTVIIRDGILESYLHNRESAARYGVAPTGNARAWEYADEPLIRMRNTYLEPGQTSLEEMIASTSHGYLLDGPRNGQADATGEFMFGVQEAREIKDGKLGALVKGVTVTGIAFDVLSTVDRVSDSFRWDLGSGYCGKGQPAKVDAGGPYIRCKALLGGEQ